MGFSKRPRNKKVFESKDSFFASDIVSKDSFFASGCGVRSREIEF